MRFVRSFRDVGLGDIASVGGKNASLGELVRNVQSLGIRVPEGFAVTVEAFEEHMRCAGLDNEAKKLLASSRSAKTIHDVHVASESLRAKIVRAPIPQSVATEIESAYRQLSKRYQDIECDVAVRSSATAEDLPAASFAGQQESFLNVRGASAVNLAVRKAFASLFATRAIRYRLDIGLDESSRVGISIGIQKMVRSDLASSGVIFTLDPDTGHRGVVLVTSSYGLGESIVQGKVVADSVYVHKETLSQGFAPIIWKKVGTKETKIVYAATDNERHAVRSEIVSVDERQRLSLSDSDILTLARWAVAIEDHYSRVRAIATPMDIEWAKDGQTGDLYIVQARPETVHSQQVGGTLKMYRWRSADAPLVTGIGVGNGVACARVRVVTDARQIDDVKPGEIVVTETTDPDWEPLIKKAAGLVTERGGRTSHAAIVARELGIPAVVGAPNAMTKLETGKNVTLACGQGEVGYVYPGTIAYEVEEIDVQAIPRPRTKVMLNVGNPEQALKLAHLPSDGVGLARMEFIFASWVGIHPLALTRYASLSSDVRSAIDERVKGFESKTEYFVDRLSQGVATIAAAFYPRPVIVRFSDFKTNEYAKLLGGESFEPDEENPMLGWRGASRYYDSKYEEGFALEVESVRRVREQMGLTNISVMIPFCRTPEEGQLVMAKLNQFGLRTGPDGVRVLVMAEIPSNIILARSFSKVFDGFSIGSNDLTQLALGVDRDSAAVAHLFNERNEAVKWMCAHLIEQAHAAGQTVGICGQAPSDYPDFATFLVECGIDSVSLSPDALVRTMKTIVEAESKADLARKHKQEIIVREVLS